jgi:hypothetical protein
MGQFPAVRRADRRRKSGPEERRLAREAKLAAGREERRRNPKSPIDEAAMSAHRGIVLQKSQNAGISAERQNKRQLSIDVASNALPKSPVSSSQNEVVPPHQRSIAARTAQKIWDR